MRKTYKILCKAAVILSIVVMVAQLILAIFAKDSLPDIIVTVAAITLGVEAVGMLVAGIAYSFTITNPGKKHLYAIMIIAGLTNILFLIAGFVGLKSKDEETDRLISEDKIAVFFRKIMVTLKYRTNIVPMVVMLVCWCAVRVLVLSTVGRVWHDILLACWIYPVTWCLSTIVNLLYLHSLQKNGLL